MSRGGHRTALWLAIIGALAPALGARDLLLREATLVDPATRTIAKGDILIRDGRIAPPGTAPAPDADTIDCRSRWVIPGLIDLHVHTSGNPRPDGGYEDMDHLECARRMLRCGVVAFLNLGAQEYQGLFAMRDDQRTDPLAANTAAEIYAAGTVFGRWSLRDADSARQTISAYIAKWRPDAIKLLLDSSRRTPALLRGSADGIKAAIATARELGVRTVVHIGTWEDARLALEAGAMAITHFYDDELIPDDLVALWKEKGAVSIPTMAVQCDMLSLARDDSWLDAPLLRSVASAGTLQAYRADKTWADRTRGTIGWQREFRANNFGSLQKLHSAGVTILAGSDTGNLGTFQGYSLHREVFLLHGAGLPAWDALAAATTNAAKFLGRSAGIHPGEIAELIILDADPLAAPANTQRIHAVIHHGLRQ
jgi:imidazolonepropionase-like amidohydrolase